MRAGSAAAAPTCNPVRQDHLPETLSLPLPAAAGRVYVSGASLWVACFGQDRQDADPVMLLHGGMANSDYWGMIVPALARRYRIVVMDTRGHGRSTMGGPAFSFDRFARDVLAVLDHLAITRASVVGWSDGGDTGLTLAIGWPKRVASLITYGANANPSGYRIGGSRAPTVAAFSARAGREYRRLSPEPDRLPERDEALRHLWRTEPHLTRSDLASILAPTTVAGGDFDEVIAGAHTEQLAHSIPRANLVILPCCGHFALLQDPDLFAGTILSALSKDPPRP